MKHGKKVKKLGRKKEHRKSMLRNLIRSLFLHERIKTTLQKAKAAREFAERLITYGKKNTLATRRLAAEWISDKEVLKKLFSDIAPRFKEINGGYTRIYKLSSRRGDNAALSILELSIKSEKKEEEKKKTKKKEK